MASPFSTAGPTLEGAAECWIGGLTHELCCLPPPNGNPACWDDYFTPERCCGGTAEDVAATSRSNLATQLAGSSATFIEADESGTQKPGRLADFGGCELNIFQKFKWRSRRWYTTRHASLALYHELSSLASNFDEVYESCAPAALTALLLKMESAYFVEEDTFSEMMSVYLLHEHRAVASGALLQSHHVNGWPLVDGAARVLEMRALGRKTSTDGLGTAGLALAAPTLDVVVCYCSERLSWLRALQRVPWRIGEDRSASLRRHVALRIYHKCGQRLTESEREAERRSLVHEWEDAFLIVEVRYVDDSARADDCSAYLAYAVDRYHNLPEFTVFLHADAPEHIPNIELLMDTIFAASRGYWPLNVGFMHLAHNFVSHDLAEGKNRRDVSLLDAFEFPRLWRSVFRSSVVPSLLAGDLNAYCCVQFIVRRERIRLRDHSFYMNALDYFGTSARSYHDLFPGRRHVWKADTLGRTPCQLAMYIWHVMFGEPLQLPRRQNDPRLPLFTKMQNIEVEVLGDEEDAEAKELLIEDQMLRGHSTDGPASASAKLESLFTSSVVEK